MSNTFTNSTNGSRKYKKSAKNETVSSMPMDIDDAQAKRQNGGIVPYQIRDNSTIKSSFGSNGSNTVNTTTNSHLHQQQNERYFNNKPNDAQEPFQQQIQPHHQYHNQEAGGYVNFSNIDNKKLAATCDINMLVDLTLSRTSLDPEVVLAAAQLFQFANHAYRHAAVTNAGGYYLNNPNGAEDMVPRPSAMSLSNLLLPSSSDESGAAAAASSSQTASEKKLFPDDKILMSFN
ncbi:4697_t:CDS:2 [Ambispora gerdemannii]|uniref:4697_t:CDS:1 n=1 Tax=Ambispora gerdemannii TaxID=144530 RepID=A0A9N8V9D7_9GLOM|nr:4697_t:CDS:2 [Ambispora gerdemannii]